MNFKSTVLSFSVDGLVVYKEKSIGKFFNILLINFKNSTLNGLHLRTLAGFAMIWATFVYPRAKLPHQVITKMIQLYNMCFIYKFYH